MDVIFLLHTLLLCLFLLHTLFMLRVQPDRQSTLPPVYFARFRNKLLYDPLNPGSGTIFITVEPTREDDRTRDCAVVSRRMWRREPTSAAYPSRDFVCCWLSEAC